MDNVSSDIYRSIKGNQNMIFTKKKLIQTCTYLPACSLHIYRVGPFFPAEHSNVFLVPDYMLVFLKGETMKSCNVA